MGNVAEKIENMKTFVLDRDWCLYCKGPIEIASVAVRAVGRYEVITLHEECTRLMTVEELFELIGRGDGTRNRV